MTMMYEPVAHIEDTTGALKRSMRPDTEATHRLVVFRPSASEGALHVNTVLDAKDYPVLAQIWDNESDAIFDEL